MGREYKGPPVPHRFSRRIAIEKGTDARGFTESPPLEHGAGGSVPKAVAGGTYQATAGHHLQPAPLKHAAAFPGKNMKGG